MIHGLAATLAIILCLLCVIGIHELGHAVAAKLCGVKIKRITLGFGKPLFSWSLRSQASVDLCIWPLGGRVHLSNTQVESVPQEDYPFCFNKKPIWIRTIILLAGGAANFLVAFLALWLMMMVGFKQIPAMIGTVTASSPAAAAGLKAQDHITQVADQKTNFWRDVSMQILMHIGQSKVPLTVCTTTNQCRKTTIDLHLWQQKNQRTYDIFKTIGIVPDTALNNVELVTAKSFKDALFSAGAQLIQLFCFLLIMMKQILTSHIPFASLIGPFKLFQAIIDSFSQGLAIFLYFIANFSIAMGLVNLLPIPGLDGGGILYGFIEKIRGKPISIAFEILMYQLLSIAFVLIFVQLVLNDLRFYFG